MIFRMRYPMLFLGAFMLGILSTLVFIESYAVGDSLSPSFTSYVIGSDRETAAASDSGRSGSRLLSLMGFSNEERDSPGDWIKEHQIHVSSDRVIIDLKDPEWASFTDTNSMDPVIDSHANAIEVVPGSPSEISVGDIVSYKSDYADGTIIHRVIEIGFDEVGWYAIMKGDNNPREDPGKVRFSQVRRVLVAIIY